MNIEPLRPSFQCLFFSKHEEARSAFQLVQNSGFQVSLVLDDVEKFFSEIKRDPPHLICLFQQEFQEVEAKVFCLRVRKLLPETALFWIGNHAYVTHVYDRMGFGFYGVIGWPLTHVSQLIHQLDHAIGTAFYLYENEQLKQATQNFVAPVKRTQLVSSDYVDFQKSIFQQTNFTNCVDLFMDQLQSMLNPIDGHALFFKYIGPRKTLVLHRMANVTRDDVRGVGLNFSELDPHFKKSDIARIEQHPAFQEMLRDVFEIEKFHLLKLEVDREVQGLLVLWNLDATSELYYNIEARFQLLSHHSLNLELDRRLHSNQILDPSSKALTKHHFLQKVAEEVARARRTSLPLSFVLMSIDQQADLQNRFNNEDLALLFKSLVKIVKRHSRLNDLVGRLSQDEFAILLPHTAAKGAAIKAERIRRMIESADFSQILPDYPQLTLSLGVSEYPSVCKDGDELFQSADRALFELRKTERNKVIMAQAPEGFIADFVFPKPNY
jgi:diguanylate cyclase (GGDEF)-like protein